MQKTRNFNLGAMLTARPDPDRDILWEHRSDGTVRAWTGAELDTLANGVARGLLKRHLRRGDAIAVLSSNSAAFVALYFGAMRAGIVVVPVNWKLNSETIAFILADCEAKMVFADAERITLCPADAQVVEMESTVWNDFIDPGAFDAIIPEPEEIAQMLYTSGSTGRPKGVPLSHAGQHWAVSSVSREGYDAHRLLVAAPMYHMNALFNLKFAFFNGAQVALMPNFTAESYVDATIQHEITWLTSVPTMLSLVANYMDGRARPDAFDGVARIFMGSSPYSAALLARVRALFPNALITNGYGTTEAGPAVFGPHPDGIPTPDLALGYPLSGGEIRLVDAGGRVVEGVGEGVLEMRNPATMRGYHNLPGKSRDALRDGWYHSGDVVRRDEHGFLWFVGRDDDMFVCGGENIWPVEVEQMLERHPDIDQAIVVPVPDEIKQKLPVAFVVRREASTLSESDVKAWALANGPAYQHPRHVQFLDALPLAGTNKIDRNSLTERARTLFPSRATA